ncbi:UvrD-helicase domain-containing protein [Azospirillum isscasi]|uniref:DNA 3'-5' helicase n=1 Tax=Azospirillum isscasi TaxID=3053926 RepID=A0ABU0WHM4_9PROT|nr:UvrD-helicase domain-containing protein [Azospirillum isscasi]MDQ2103725.1 UvrD-helicase domain-containing protein [Azospirillum isscasi]
MSDPYAYDDPLGHDPLSHAGAPAPAPARRFAYLDGLNPVQREAVEALDGPVLVLAGAGTGKTRVLTTRLAHLLMTRRAAAFQILAVTFTNKAAREMRERVAHLMGVEPEGWWLGTFHALAARILRRHAELVGLKSNFTILDTDDQIRLIKQLLEAANIDSKKWPARQVLGVIERWKDRGLTPDRLGESDGGDVAGGRVVALYRQYQERLRTLNACDFGDLLLHNLAIFQKHPDVLAEYHRKFKYILVDEYQDTNVAQYLWLRILSQAHKNICCVGDEDQCVAGGTLVTMGDGTRRAVEQVQAGDCVMSAHGAGNFRPARVTEVFERVFQGDLVRIQTESGHVLLTTPEHSHFADVIHSESPQRYFTYLMHKRGYGYRVGTSQIYTRGQKYPVIGYQQRCLQERADAVWLVRAFDSENDARELEHTLSLRYGITTFPFVARKGSSKNGLVHDQDRLDRLHAALAQTARVVELMEDFGLDPAHPHHIPQTATGRRRNLILTLNAESRGSTPMHRISLSGNDAGGAAAVAEIGLKARLYKRDPQNWRFETVFKDFRRLEEIKSSLMTRFDLTVVRKANILGKALTVRPAAQVVPGMVIALGEGRHDVVTSVERVPFVGTVHDLNVEGTHNFVANGIVTHNSIYAWRGAEIGNILRFEADFPGAKVVKLEQNYRSTGHILSAASGLIANNKGRLGKTLWTQADGGEPVRVRGVWDGEEEARWVGDEIEALQRQGVSLAQIAVLVRAGFQTREFEERFITLGLPYRVIGGPRFYERQEIRDALAYLRVVHSPDDDLAFERIVNVPKRGVGPAAMQCLYQAARARGIPLTEAGWALTETDELKPKVRGTVRNLLQDFFRWRTLSATMPHTDLARMVLDESGYTRMWQEDKTPEAPGRLENLKELVTAMAEFENLSGFLEHVALVMENAEAAGVDQVTVMTLHGAKGLEFDMVFLPGWEEGVFPNQRALDETGIAGLEEERRLAYVGLTRARKRAYISHAANRRLYGNWVSAIPSRFVDEIPGGDVEAEAASGLYAGAGAGAGARGGGGFRDSPSFAAFRSGQQAAGRQQPPARTITLDSGSYQVAPRARPNAPFPKGARVFHQKFGYGTVTAVEQDKLEIDFDQAGSKKVMDSFVVPADKAG